MLPKVSIIVPTRRIDDHVRECVRECLKLDYPAFEIIVVTDAAEPALPGSRGLVSGPVPPGAKRNLGANAAEGDVLAFIDADAYPRADWLLNAVGYLQAGAGGVGGPGITPPHDPPVAHVSGFILGSFLMGGSLAGRYTATSERVVDDIHSCNFVAWRKVVEETGGWNEKYWPGEDTLLCRAIHLNGHKLVLAPDVVVHHHRRPNWSAHIKQIWNYGLHRGFFAKRFPETSRKPMYFAPSALVLGVVLGPLLALAWPPLWLAYTGTLALYLALCALASLKTPKYRWSVFGGIPITHAVYGTAALAGLIARRLSR